MVLTKTELIAALQNEVRILLHLTSKIDRTQLDYRPTPKQRSTIELVQYLSVMGPRWLQYATAGAFDVAASTAAEHAAEGRDFDQSLAAIAAQADAYATLLADVSDADLRTELEGVGSKTTRGAFIVTYVLCECAVYRMQLVYAHGRLCGAALTPVVVTGATQVTVSRDLSWSLTLAHERLMPRYWPDGPPKAHQVIKAPPGTTTVSVSWSDLVGDGT